MGWGGPPNHPHRPPPWAVPATLCAGHCVPLPHGLRVLSGHLWSADCICMRVGRSGAAVHPAADQALDHPIHPPAARRHRGWQGGLRPRLVPLWPHPPVLWWVRHRGVRCPERYLCDHGPTAAHVRGASPCRVLPSQHPSVPEQCRWWRFWARGGGGFDPSSQGPKVVRHSDGYGDGPNRHRMLQPRVQLQVCVVRGGRAESGGGEPAQLAAAPHAPPLPPCMPGCWADGPVCGV